MKSSPLILKHHKHQVQPGAVKLVLWRHWMHPSYMDPVISENQFHCTRLSVSQESFWQIELINSSPNMWIRKKLVSSTQKTPGNMLDWRLPGKVCAGLRRTLRRCLWSRHLFANRVNEQGPCRAACPSHQHDSAWCTDTTQNAWGNTHSKFSWACRFTQKIDHLHNYGPGTRFGASQARFGCVVCVSHWSFRFSSALECRSAITVVFLAFSIEAGLVLHSSLMVFHGQVSSGSAGYLPFVRLTGRTSASPTTRSYALSTSSLQQIFAFMLVPKSLWTLPSPVLWNRVRLDTSRKQVQCHRCFLFTRMGPKWEYDKGALKKKLHQQPLWLLVQFFFQRPLVRCT